MIKRLFLLSVFSLVWCTCMYAKDLLPAQVPAPVRAYVEKNHPSAADVKWDYDEDDGVYEAEFRVDGLECKLEISPAGILVRSKQDVRAEEIPSAIRQYLDEEYAGYKILGANKQSDGKQVRYDVGVKGKNVLGYTRHCNILFDARGKVIED